MEEDALSSPPEPTELLQDLRQQFQAELNAEEDVPNMGGRAVESSQNISPEVATTVADQVASYLWEEWAEPLDETELDRSQFDRLVSLPQSEAVRWLKGEIGWEFYAEVIERNVYRRDDILE